MSVRCRQSRVGGAGPSGCSVTAIENARGVQLALDGALDFTTSQANVLQLAIAQTFELKTRLALDTPTQIGYPPRLQPGD
jgi:hypothetical protein